jgi:hypothetical protein
MMMSFGSGLTSAYFYLDADETKLKAAHLHYRIDGGAWQQSDDDEYPFEFTVPLNNDAGGVDWWVEGDKVSAGKTQTAQSHLSR